MANRFNFNRFNPFYRSRHTIDNQEPDPELESEPERDDDIAGSGKDEARLEATGLTPPDADREEEKDVDPKVELGGGDKDDRVSAVLPLPSRMPASDEGDPAGIIRPEFQEGPEESIDAETEDADWADDDVEMEVDVDEDTFEEIETFEEIDVDDDEDEEMQP